MHLDVLVSGMVLSQLTAAKHADVTGERRSGGREVLVLVRGSFKKLCVAVVEDAVALVVPHAAVLGGNGTQEVPAMSALIEAILGRIIAALFRVVGWHFGSTPVVTLQRAVGRLQSFGLDEGSTFLDLLGRGGRLSSFFFSFLALLWGAGNEDIWARHGERHLQRLLVDIIVHGGLLEGVEVFANGDRRGFDVAARVEEELSTAHKRLGVRGIVGGRVKSQELEAQQIVTGFNAPRQSQVEKTAVFKELIRSPLLLGQVVDGFPDLEPAVSGGVVGFRGVCDLF